MNGRAHCTHSTRPSWLGPLIGFRELDLAGQLQTFVFGGFVLFHLAYHVPTRSGVKMHPGPNRQVEGQQGSAIHSQPNRSIRTWHQQGLIGVTRGLLCNMVFACYSACRGWVRGGSFLEMQCAFGCLVVQEAKTATQQKCSLQSAQGQ